MEWLDAISNIDR